MKAKTLIAILLVTAFMLPSCAGAWTPVGPGTIFTSVKGPLDATSASGGTKMGTSEAMSILGIVAMGDASIQAAKNAGGISTVSHVDHESFSVLGIYATFKTVVYGN